MDFRSSPPMRAEYRTWSRRKKLRWWCQEGEYELLAAGALRLLDDPTLAQSMIEQAREECRKYLWEAVREQWLNLYQELAAGSGARETSLRAKELSQQMPRL